MWKITVYRGGPQMTVWHMRTACRIPKAKNTHSEYVILNACPLKQWLYECALMLSYTHIACFVEC
jgi:hypothetical protein